MPRRCRPLLGTFVEIDADSEAAIEGGFEAIARVHHLMSAHQPESDLSRVNRLAHRHAVEVDAWTALVLERALFWSRRSEGAFDIVRAGKVALQRGLIPHHADQPPAEASHWTWLALEGMSIRLFKPACLDLGGIAKGFAVDRAVEAMITAGAERGLVNAGGDLRAFGSASWPVEVVDPTSRAPRAAINLRNAALATSAGLPSDIGLQFKHLPDARGSWTSVTVQATSCCDADALSKIVWAGGVNVTEILRDSSAPAFAMTKDGTIHEIGEEVHA